MAKFDDKVNGNTVSADEYNNIVRASKNTIENSGQTIDATNTQLSKAVANYAAISTYYTESGAANAYVLTPIGNFESPHAYTDGMLVRFRAGNANTGASTVNVNSLGAANIKLEDGTTDPSAGDIPTNSDTILRYDNANSAFIIVSGIATATKRGLIEIATNAELAAGSDSSRAVVPSALLSLFNASSQSTNGYMRIPVNISSAFDELIFQWGLSASTIDSAGTMTVTLPLTYPTSQLWAGGTFKSDNTLSITDSSLMTDTLSTTQIVFDRGTNGGGSSHALNVYWISIGY